MSKIFTWLFGAITGLLAGIMLVAWDMANDPRGFAKMAETFIKE